MVTRDINYFSQYPLVKGEHFGEVSLLFGCKRTATVISKSYCIFGVLDHRDFLNLMMAYPEYKTALFCHVY